MNYFKLQVQYIGTNFYGFQFQEEVPTIQSEINQALNKILVGKTTTMGASRTDAGVHAFSQYIKVSTESTISPNFLEDLNQDLPDGIKCLSIEDCSWDFRPANDAKNKEYRYFFSNELNSEGREQSLLANVPQELNLALMNEACELIVGRHSFHNFYTTGSNVKSFEREIFECKLELVNVDAIFNNSIFKISSNIKECFQFKIIGEGFLKQMVRHLVSAIWLVGREKLSLEEFEHLLKQKEKAGQLWRAAPARGLYLYRINY